MTIDKKKVYAYSIILCVCLLLAFFIPFQYRRIIVSIMLLVGAILAHVLIKKRSILSINKWQVAFIMGIISLLFVMVYYLTGLEYGFYRNLLSLAKNNLFKNILPITVIVISIELIRMILVAQKSKVANVLIFISCVLTDVMVLSNQSSISSFDRFMDVAALAILPAISANVLYTMVSKNYGMVPNIIYRLVISLYPLVITIIPKTPNLLLAFVMFVLPFIIYAFINLLYKKQKKVVSTKKKASSYISTGIFAVLMVSIVMLISCQFRFGVLVIGSPSMTGAINEGDVVVFEQYRDQYIKEGDVIIFEKNNQRVVHRVVEITNINNEIRYYTKGDANPDRDSGYITQSNIVGVTHFRIMYIGHPTLWIRDLFKK